MPLEVSKEHCDLLAFAFESSSGEEDTFVKGRATLGGAAAPEIRILRADGQIAAYLNGAWNSALPNFAIFDSVFIAENVYSGEVVDFEHRRRLQPGRFPPGLHDPEDQALRCGLRAGDRALARPGLPEKTLGAAGAGRGKCLKLARVGHRDTNIVEFDIEEATQAAFKAQRKVLLDFYHDGKGD